MATQPIEALPEEAQEVSPPSMLEAMAAQNLVPLLDESDVNKIGSEAVAEYAIDLLSCDDFHQRYDRAMEMACQVSKEKTFPWPRASNVIFPLLTQAAIQFQARAYPAIIDGVHIVKGRVLGQDENGEKRKRADRVANHMSWQFLNDVPGWEEDTDKLLLTLPIVGCMFRKTWHDPIRNQNNSETVTAKDFVVNYRTTSLDKAPRFTHVQRYYPHEIEAFIRAGEWAEIKYDGEEGADPHSLVDIYEQNRLIDMDDDGLPEPYVVTVTKDGAVARIVACFDADGIFCVSTAFDGQKSLRELVDSQQIPQDMRIVRIERKEYFTKYGFIPAPDGSFYDMGFGTLTDNLGAATNTLINQLIDAGTLSNMQGGFIGGGTKIKSGNMRFTPGEWKRVEGMNSGPLRDNILPLQLPGPSPVLFSLLGMLIEAVKGITSVSDILTGNQETQTAPTTALALIEEGQKVFTAIYQRIHRAFGGEIKIMRRLNRDYLDEKVYFSLQDNPEAVGAADYEDRDLDVVPVSDPRAINDRVKVAKAQILMSHNGDPLINQVEIRRRAFEAAGITDIPKLFEVPPPMPSPEQLESAAKTGAEVRAKDADTANSLVQAAKATYELGVVLNQPETQTFALALLAEAMALADKVVKNESADGPGAVQEMEGQPVDEGLSPIPGGLPGPVGVPMGQGAANDGSPAIAG